MCTPTLLLMLLGCPYIFGGPDLSQVKGGNTRPDATSETASRPTAADTGTRPPTADTGPTSTARTAITAHTGATGPTGATASTGDTGTEPIGDPPVIEALSVGYRYDGVVLVVTLSDPDGDLEGGTVHVVDGKSTASFVVPDDALSWDPKLGEARVKFLPDDYCDGIDRSLRVSASDAAGHLGGDAPITATVFGVGRLVETGTYTTPVGLIELPAVFCGEATDDYDSDYVDFRVPVPGIHQFTLGWEDKADLDLWLYEGAATVDQSVSFSTSPTERIDTNLAAGSTYQFDVSWYFGVSTDWALLIEGP